MSETLSNQQLRDIWASDAREAPTISLDFIKHLAAEHDRRVRRTNAAQVAAIVLGCVAILFYVWIIPVVTVRLGLLAILALMVRYSVIWFDQARREPVPTQGVVTDALSFYRRQLERQRDARKSDWKTWLGCLALAAIFDGLLVWGGAKPWVPIRFALTLVLSAIALGVYTASESRERRRLQREIDALDSLTR